MLIITIETITKSNIIKTITIKRKIERNLNLRKIRKKSSLRTKTTTIKSKRLLKQ